MTNPAFSGAQRIIGEVGPRESGTPASKPADEKLQGLIDKALYANGRPAAQKIRNFLNGTWLGEPLHVVLTDVPVVLALLWTMAVCLTGQRCIRSRAWRSGCETVRSKCVKRSQKADIGAARQIARAQTTSQRANGVTPPATVLLWRGPRHAKR
jgi:hypothetical protein